MSYVSMIPADGWMAELKLEDGKYLHVPVTAWALGEHGSIAPCVLVPGSGQVRAMTDEYLSYVKRVSRVRSLVLYHPAAYESDESYAEQRARRKRETADALGWTPLRNQALEDTGPRDGS